MEYVAGMDMKESCVVERESQAESKPHRILIVDDEMNVLNGFRRVLHKQNYEIITTTNAKEALKLLDIYKFSLVISDYMMPGINGLTFLKIAKKYNSDVVRFMFTGCICEKEVQIAIKEGIIDKFISKPVVIEDMLESIASVVDG